MRGAIVLGLLLVASTATAQAPGETQPMPPKKSVVNAYLVTVAAMSTPMAIGMLISGDSDEGTRADVGGMIATAGAVFGPTAGQWYAGRVWTPGLTLRIAAAGVVGAMVLREHQEPLELGTIVIGLTTVGALWGTGMVWDLVTLPSTVRRYNREHAVVVAPLVGNTTGLAVGGTF
jgi:hypothetical protein